MDAFIFFSFQEAERGEGEAVEASRKMMGTPANLLSEAIIKNGLMDGPALLARKHIYSILNLSIQIYPVCRNY